MATNLYPSFFIDGQIGNTLSVPASGDWNVELNLYDRDGVRYQTVGATATASIEFYAATGRENALAFEIAATLSATEDGQANFAVIGSLVQFAVGTTMYGYIKLIIDGNTIVSPNYVTIVAY